MSIDVRKHSTPRQRTQAPVQPAPRATLLGLMLRKPLLTVIALVVLVIFADDISRAIQHAIISILPGVTTLAIFLLSGAWTVGKLKSLFR